MKEQQQQQEHSYAVAPVQLFRPVDLMPTTAENVCTEMSVYSTYDVSKPEVRGELYDIMVQGGKKADEFIGQTFAVRQVTVFPVSFTDKQSGEIVTMPLVLITTDKGDVIQFVSRGIWGSLLMMRACGYAPFGKQQQLFKLVQVPMGDGKRFYQLHRAKPEGKK